MAQLHSTLLYFVCPVVDTGDGSSGGLSLGALRLGGSNVEAGGVATQEEIAECTCSGGSTCQGVNVDAKDGMRLAEVLRRHRRGVLGVERGGGARGDGCGRQRSQHHWLAMSSVSQFQASTAPSQMHNAWCASSSR
eukprot:jgi/Tetstr1/443269/TSEL_031303.t1